MYFKLVVLTENKDLPYLWGRLEDFNKVKRDRFSKTIESLVARHGEML